MRTKILIEALDGCRHGRCPCCPDFKHFSVAFRGRKIITKGFNCRCRIPKELCNSSRSNHAETSSLFKVRDNKPFDLLVIRTNRDGSKLLNSKPCEMCLSWIMRYPVQRLYYSDGEGISSVTLTVFIKSIKTRKHHCCAIETKE
jgi:hypothetical protein